MASASNGDLEVLTSSQHVVVEKSVNDRFTVTENEKQEECFMCDVCAVVFPKRKSVRTHITKKHERGEWK